MKRLKNCTMPNEGAAARQKTAPLEGQCHQLKDSYNLELPLEGGAPRSESGMTMIAGGNHSIMSSCQSRCNLMVSRNVRPALTQRERSGSPLEGDEGNSLMHLKI